MKPRSHFVPALVCGMLASALVWWLAGNRLVLITDEGISLEAGRRIWAGQVPYRDFFLISGPGNFWNVSLMFRLFGLTLAAARMLLVAEIGLFAAGVYWLAARLSSPLAAAVISLSFVGCVALNHAVLVVSHRWDSSAAAFAGLLLAWAALERGRRWMMVGAGALAAYAAWITPSVALVGLAMAAWFLVRRDTRRWLPPLALGGAGLSAMAAAVLAWQGALGPMVEHLLWARRNYGAVNWVPYGHMAGGYGALLEGVSGTEWAVRTLILFFYSLPPLLPVVALGWLAYVRRESQPVSLALVCGAALVASTYPRWEIEHLTFVSPLLFVLAGTFIAKVAWRGLRAPMAIVFGLASICFVIVAAMDRASLETVDTARGTVVGPKAEVAMVRQLLNPMPKGSVLFAYDDLPSIYFFVDTVNPTRFLWMHPGLMSKEQQREAIHDLELSPPDRIVYGKMSEEELKRLWPSSTPEQLHLSLLDAWIGERYAPPEKRAALEVWLPKGAGVARLPSP